MSRDLTDELLVITQAIDAMGQSDERLQPLVARSSAAVMRILILWDNRSANSNRLCDALTKIAGTDFDEPSDFSELGRIARAALSAGDA